MRRLDVVLRVSAWDDLDSLIRFIVANGASLHSARNYAARIRARCLAIGNAPHGGRARDDLEPGIRTVPFERSAVILYRVEMDRVEIVNIFYGGRDYEALYGDPDPQRD